MDNFGLVTIRIKLEDGTLLWIPRGMAGYQSKINKHPSTSLCFGTLEMLKILFFLIAPLSFAVLNDLIIFQKLFFRSCLVFYIYPPVLFVVVVVQSYVHIVCKSFWLICTFHSTNILSKGLSFLKRLYWNQFHPQYYRISKETIYF